MVDYCPRCGARDQDAQTFCYMCSDGAADATRASEVVEAVRSGRRAAHRILRDMTDPRAFEVVAAAATDPDDEVRRSALIALGGIRDARAIPVVVASLDHEDDLVRHSALDTLAELGPGAADAVAERLADPRDRQLAAQVLAWLHDDRAIQPLAMAIESEDVIGLSVLHGRMFSALSWIGGERAIAVLAGAADRIIAAEASRTHQEWQTVQAASIVAQALIDMRDPSVEPILDRLRAPFPRLYVTPADPLPPFVAPPHPRRTVPRWSFDLQASETPITEPVGKVGGQPVWIESPTWPTGTDGAPTTFLAQFAIPGRSGLVYLFLDPSDETYERQGIVFAQPGRPPDAWLPWATGPTTWAEVKGPRSFEPRVFLRATESRLVLESGLDFDDWQVLLDDPATERDDDHDWNKVLGTPRWLQGDETPVEPGWRFVFQYTAYRMGREMADGAECYGLLHDDGRSRFVVQSH